MGSWQLVPAWQPVHHGLEVLPPFDGVLLRRGEKPEEIDELFSIFWIQISAAREIVQQHDRPVDVLGASELGCDRQRGRGFRERVRQFSSGSLTWHGFRLSPLTLYRQVNIDALPNLEKKSKSPVIIGKGIPIFSVSPVRGGVDWAQGLDPAIFSRRAFRP